jgi:hypothetical protein
MQNPIDLATITSRNLMGRFFGVLMWNYASLACLKPTPDLCWFRFMLNQQAASPASFVVSEFNE